jgi:hypothetical protein
MASDFSMRTAACPVCGDRMTATVKLMRGWGSEEVLRVIPQNVSCVNGCEQDSSEVRSQMMQMFAR